MGEENMTDRIKDMTVGRPLPLLISFSLPLMMGNVFQQLYTVVDTMVVGKALGVDALAALGATDWLYWMLLGMVQGVTQGFGILIAREFGAKQMGSLRRTIGNSLILAGICALAMMVIGQTISRPVLQLLNTPNEIAAMSLQYLRIMFMGIPIIMAYNLFATILRSLGDGRTPLNAMIVASLFNVALDLLFVLVFRWGIPGAAYASLIAQAFSSIFCLYKILQIDFITIQKSDLQLCGDLPGRLFFLGMPMAAQNAIIAIGGMIIQSVVNGYGVAFIGGFTASNKLYGVLEIAASSYGYAMITYTGQNFGAGNLKRIREGMKCATAVAVATSLLISAVMILMGRQIISAFLSGTPDEIAQATSVGYTYLFTMSCALPILYILYISRSAIQGMGNTVLPMISGIAEFFMRTGGVLLLPGLIGENGIFIAEIMAWFGAVLILLPSYLITIRRNERISGIT